MPVNKNANIRYRTLDRCFRDTRRKYYIDDLIKACEQELCAYNFHGGVSRRQIFDDIRFMESDSGYGIELDKLRDGKKVYYRYQDPNFSINQQPLSSDEAKQLQQAIATLTRFRGLPKYLWVEEVITNLEYRFNLDGKSIGLVCFDQNPLLKGVEHLGAIIDAATSHQVLKIDYHTYKYGGRDLSYIFHPYYLKQYNNRWFAFGRNDATGEITNIALDRILSLTPMPEVEYYINTEIDFDHHFDDVVGVTVHRHKTAQTIMLRATPSRYPYLESKPLHSSQRVVDRKQCIFSITVRPNLELEQQILSFGPDLEVLAPEDFRAQVAEKVKRMQELYHDV